ncbi:MAG: hypothetical protein GEV05_19920 [Betaproteobacteria bacterium]|nr:hypothetical protein [Betaproteobacteria bacterium]
MNPITQDAASSDPRWEREFLDLAHGLVMAGAKTRLIARLTDFSLQRIRNLYKVLRGSYAPSGPLAQGQARFFAMRRGRVSAAWSIQGAIFIACYERTGEIAEVPLQRGWRLLTAFNTYLNLTQELHESSRIKRLDINQAYALLTHCGFLESRNAELKRRECPVCLIRHLVAITEPPVTQRCPVCAMNANALRLARQTSASRRRSPPSRYT